MVNYLVFGDKLDANMQTLSAIKKQQEKLKYARVRIFLAGCQYLFNTHHVGQMMRNAGKDS